MTSLQDIHILIAEDDRIMQTLLHDMLDITGLKNLSIVSSGDDALRHMARRQADILITDWKMEPMSGLELAKKIRNSENSPDRFIPIIMLTGKGEVHDVEMARDIGVTEYLIKPFTASALFERIRRVVDQPRQFILSSHFKGPDRRRRAVTPPDGNFKRKNDK